MSAEKKWDLFRATMCAEGVDGYEAVDPEEWFSAFQFLIDTGAAWTLQGWFGRTAHDLINEGHCHLPEPTRTPSGAAMRARRNAVETFHKAAAQ